MSAPVDVTTPTPVDATTPIPTPTQPYSAPATTQAARPGGAQSIGADGQPIRVLSFSGGLFDAAMQLGTVHAMIVTSAKAPDVIAGVSTGAINAVAAAEILQAGDDLDTPQLRLEARVSRFRQIFEAYRQSPEDVLAPLFPDIYQIDAEAALKPANLPIYREKERANRHRAAQSRAGLITLTNDFLRLNVSVASIARVLRACLGLVATREIPSRKLRWAMRVLEAVRLWRVLAANILSLAPIGARLVRIALSPTARRLADWLRTSKALWFIVDWLPAIDASETLSALANRVERDSGAPARSEASTETVGLDAGRVIFRGWMRRHFTRGLWWVFGFGVMVTLIIGIPATTALIVTAAIIQLAIPTGHWIAGTAPWIWLVNALAAAWTAIERATPAWLESVVSFFSAIVSYLAGVVLPVVITVASGAKTAHHWLDVHWKIDTPIHAVDPTSVFLPGYILAFVAVLFVIWRARKLVSVDAILRYYGILDAVFDPYSIQSWLIRLFDPAYYGVEGMDDVVERALAGAAVRADGPTAATPKTLRSYLDRPQRIYVGPIAADVASGMLTVLPEDTPVVDALLAATAFPPVFQAQPIPSTKSPPGDATPQRWFIDGCVVANEPTRALISHLTPLVNESSTEVQIYSASSLPLSASELGTEDGRSEYSGLVDSSRRALTLQSFRDATLDRRMTDLVARALPSGKAAWRSPAAPERRFLRASVHPIELDKASSLNARLMAAGSMLERRRMIAEAVADGCRSSLEVLMHDSLGGTPGGIVACRKAVKDRVKTEHLLPCSNETSGPGLTEVCQFCAVHERRDGGPPKRHPQSLRVPLKKRNLPVWPMASDIQPPRHQAPRRGRASTETPVTTSDRIAKPVNRAWPVARNGLPGESRPTVNLLFSGGVFRGVYLAGVINALNEVGAQPDLIAGSSIGSITAAMAARVFSEPVNDKEARASRIARVAATYLSVDRLVLTDRFGDFIRNFTVRASATGFSIRDIDTTFRSFDRHRAAAFNRDARRVLAGLERLLYVSPFEAFELAHASRAHRYDKVFALLGNYAQEWLERGAVGLEILGSEPLELLVRNHVLDGAAVNDVRAENDFTTRLERNGLQFVATVTNLTRGRLETLHIPSTSAAPERRARLVEALLASSAFPAVFRPRWSWEVLPETNAVEQFIDGGVMDNLPLDAVARFLNDAREMNRLAPRPKVRGVSVPHLLFAGSLQCERPRLPSEQATRYIARRWIQAYRRAKELSYNNKIEGYAATQQGLRAIWQGDETVEQDRFEPLDLEVVAVKPQWLCHTFAFHPMLGFQRAEQARSIAHGCKTTLERLYALSRTHSTWIEGWGLTLRDEWTPTPDNAAGARGKCWYRPTCDCPFSAQSLARAEQPMRENMKREVARIHEFCGLPQTHDRRSKNPLLRAEDAPPEGHMTESAGHAIG